MGIIKEHNIDGYRIMTEAYYNTSDIVNDLKKRNITNRSFDNMQNGTLGGNSKSVCGVETYEEAIELLEKGYQPIVEKLKANIGENVRGLSKRISFSNDVVGFAPVVPLAIMGVPTSMINTRIKPIKAKVIDLYVDITYTASDTSDEIIKSSSRILSVVLKLEQAGYRFNIFCVKSQSDERDCDMMIVKIKNAAQPVDLKRISFPVAHTAFSRVIGWDWYSRFPKGRYRCGYGRSLTLHANFKNEWAKKMFGDNAILIGAKMLMKKDEKYIEEVFTKCGNSIKA